MNCPVLCTDVSYPAFSTSSSLRSGLSRLEDIRGCRSFGAKKVQSRGLYEGRGDRVTSKIEGRTEGLLAAGKGRATLERGFYMYVPWL